MAPHFSCLALSIDEEATVKEIDKDYKNKFKFDWLEKVVHIKRDGVDCKVKIGDSIVKINVSGKASCKWCSLQKTTPQR